MKGIKIKNKVVKYPGFFIFYGIFLAFNFFLYLTKVSGGYETRLFWCLFIFITLLTFLLRKILMTFDSIICSIEKV